jgi:vacuolar-type H+-ATPase subunit H
MKDEIDTIIQADEAARKRLEASRAEARNMRNEAERKADEIAVQKEKELEAARKEGLDQLIAEARGKAQRIGEETGGYIKRIEQKKQELTNELIGRLLERVLGS